jgi:2'-5' RNA ligase
LEVDSALDVRRFHPHITLARIERSVDSKKLECYLHQHRAYEGIPFRVEAFQLFSSELSRSGPPVYRAVRAFGLE